MFFEDNYISYYLAGKKFQFPWPKVFPNTILPEFHHLQARFQLELCFPSTILFFFAPKAVKFSALTCHKMTYFQYIYHAVPLAQRGASWCFRRVFTFGRQSKPPSSELP